MSGENDNLALIAFFLCNIRQRGYYLTDQFRDVYHSYGTHLYQQCLWATSIHSLCFAVAPHVRPNLTDMSWPVISAYSYTQVLTTYSRAPTHSSHPLPTWVHILSLVSAFSQFKVILSPCNLLLLLLHTHTPYNLCFTSPSNVFPSHPALPNHCIFSSKSTSLNKSPPKFWGPGRGFMNWSYTPPVPQVAYSTTM